MIAFFRKKYRVKRFGGQENYKGYATSGYADIEPVALDVQEITDKMTKETHGKRDTKTVCAFGQFDFRAAESPDQKGDLLFYNGHWYECTSCVLRHNTMLRHYYAEFTLLPDGEKYNENP